MASDLLVVGAGPAGVSAALWAVARGLSLAMIEADERPGGQLHLVHFHPRELAGIETGDGPSIADTYARQLGEARAPLSIHTRAVALERLRLGAAAVVTASGETIAAKAVLIATGARRRRLEVPGERELMGRGVSTSATLDRARFAGKDVVVVGGGDAAYENALLLSAVGCRVTLVVRGAPRARPEFHDRAAADGRIEELLGTRVLAFLGAERLEAVRLEGVGGVVERPAAGAVIKVGMIPNTEWCRSVGLDARGFVAADPRGRTSAPGVWAAGDVVGPALPSIAVAHGGAALAVADVRRALAED